MTGPLYSSLYFFNQFEGQAIFGFLGLVWMRRRFLSFKRLFYFKFVILGNRAEQECFSTQLENFVLNIAKLTQYTRQKKWKSKASRQHKSTGKTNKQSLFMKCGGIKNSICSFELSLLTIVLQMLPWSFQNMCWPSLQMSD